jgi:acetyltransferase
VPDQVDLAVIVTPAPTVPGVIAECVEAGVKGAIIISAGFKETAKRAPNWNSRSWSRRARPDAHHRPQLPGRDESAHRHQRHLCQGHGRCPAASASSARAARSAPRCSTGAAKNVGFSAFISIGSMLDVDWADLLYYLGMTSAPKPS